MDTLTKIYVACGCLLVIGIAWVVYRIIVYHRAEKMRNSESERLFSEEQFKSFIEDLKKQTSDRDQPGAEEQTLDTPDESVSNPGQADTPDEEEPQQ